MPDETLPSVVLLAQVQRGETAALDTLVRRYWPRLERWARGRLPERARDLHDTGDLVQETLVAALGRLHDFVPEHDGALLAYLRMACLNRIRSLIRRSVPPGQKVEVDSMLLDYGESPLEQAIGTDAVARYERALSRLRPEDRDAICAKVELDLPYEEIASALGKPTITAARMTVSRALARLAREMQRNV
jgi:RNA polymerase sigma factor (sigma-70 family)